MVGSRRDRPRAACFEQYEPRVPLSADPLAQAAVEPSVAAAANSPDIAATVRRLHDEYQLTGAGQTVVVIDSGIAYDHRALGGGFGAGHHVVGGWDFTGERDADPYDDGPAGFHGTHVAGIIGSLDPRQIGLAPGADLIALRVFDDQGHSDFRWIEEALQWVHQQRDQFEHPITTVNLSIGLLPETQLPEAARVLEDEFAQLSSDGIFISVAAGNGYDAHEVAGLSYPASSQWVVPVGSVNGDGKLSAFSRRDERMLAAPGENIRSTVTDFLFDFNGVTDDWYAFSGTSQAAPFVAGAAVLVRQAMQRAGHRAIDQATIYQALRETADWIADETGSYPRIDLVAAVESVLSTAVGASTDGLREDAKRGVSRSTPKPRAVDTEAVDLGAVGFARLQNLVVSNRPLWYRLTAAVNGMLAAEVKTERGNDAALELFDHDGRPLTGQFTSTGRKRINWTATQGQTFYLCLEGRAAGAELTFAQLATESTPTGLSVEVPSQVERVELTRGTDWTLSLDGLPFRLNVPATTRVHVRAEANDAVTIHISERTPGAYLHAEFTDVVGPGGWLRVSGSQHVEVRAAAGSQAQARLYGTSGTDRFVGRPDRAALEGNGYRLAAHGFERVYAFGGDGDDSAQLYGSAGNDVLVVRADHARLSSSWQLNLVESFEQIVAYAGGGVDRAFFYGSASDDSFAAFPDAARLASGHLWAYAEMFARVYATAGPGGFDRAQLYGADDRAQLHATGHQSTLTAATFLYQVTAFDRVLDCRAPMPGVRRASRSVPYTTEPGPGCVVAVGD